MTLFRQLPAPRESERPSVYADRIGQWYTAAVTEEHKRGFAQYLTPVGVATFMAGMCTPAGESVSVLDPGAGAGILSCAVCEALAEPPGVCKSISLATYEADEPMAALLQHCLAYTSEWLRSRGITLQYCVKTGDFVITHASILDQTPRLFPEPSGQTGSFDVVISNPPYFKVPKSDPRAQMTAAIVHGQPNIYAMFMAVSASLLKPGGHLVFITPRSYAAGPYFRLFRERFFTIMKPRAIHLFASRRDAFDRDEVLQENIILLAQRADGWAAWPHEDMVVEVSTSAGMKDLAKPNRRSVPLAQILDVHSKHWLLRIPVTQADDCTTRTVHAWTGSLHAYGLEVSTGPVVAFRAAQFICKEGDIATTHAPLLWMQNVRRMQATWPLARGNKAQFITVTDASLPLLVARGNYVLLRRFSAKEEQQRLVAAPLLARTVGSPLLGFENHLNYIHRPHGQMSEEEASGLAAILNSRLLDTYFRTFNGNTQVSATELRALPLPSREVIKEIGQHAMLLDSQNGDLDELVQDTLLITQSMSESRAHA